MSESRELQLSEKISKSDKYLPALVLKKLYRTVDDVRDLTYIMFHAETGLRVSDVCGDRKDGEYRPGVEIHNVDWQNLRVYTYDHKKDAWRWVYFPDRVKAQLKQWLKYRQAAGIKGRELFPFTPKTANRILKRWCKEIGFQYAHVVSSHWLRHTFIRLSRAAGRDIKAVQQNTGDTVKTLLEWYADLSREDMRREVEDKPLVDV